MHFVTLVVHKPEKPLDGQFSLSPRIPQLTLETYSEFQS